MAINYTQTDTIPAFPTSHCATASDITVDALEATNGGSAGSSTKSPSVSSDATRSLRAFKCVVGSGISWDAGTWTTRLNVTASNMNLSITAIYICRVNSSGTNQATIGSATGLSISLGTTGVKSQNVTGSGQTPGVGDVVWVVYEILNGAMSIQSFSFTPNQNIDSPFNVAADPRPTKPVMVLQAVNRAATY